MSEEHLAGPGRALVSQHRALLSPGQGQEGTAGLCRRGKTQGTAEVEQLKSLLVPLWEIFSHGFLWCEDCSEAREPFGALQA